MCLYLKKKTICFKKSPVYLVNIQYAIALKCGNILCNKCSI